MGEELAPSITDFRLLRLEIVSVSESILAADFLELSSPVGAPLEYAEEAEEKRTA